MKVFLAGVDKTDFFMNWTRYLAERGWNIISPPNDIPTVDFDEVALAMLQKADIVAVLPGYWMTPRYRLDMQMAQALEIPVIYIERHSCAPHYAWTPSKRKEQVIYVAR